MTDRFLWVFWCVKRKQEKARESEQGGEGFERAWRVLVSKKDWATPPGGTRLVVNQKLRVSPSRLTQPCQQDAVRDVRDRQI